MTLPAEYNAADSQREIDFLQQQLTRMEQFLRMQPLSAAPISPEEGYIAVSDGTGDGFDSASGAGVYRFNGAVWIPLDDNEALSIKNLFHAVDEKSSGTAGGTFTSTSFQTRTLNTIRVNNITGASLASNQITLPAGDYYFEASAPAFTVSRHKCRLLNATDTVLIQVGTSEFASNGNDVENRSFVSGSFTLSATKAIELEHICQITVTSNGFGVEGNFGPVEIYADIKIWKV